MAFPSIPRPVRAAVLLTAAVGLLTTACTTSTSGTPTRTVTRTGSAPSTAAAVVSSTPPTTTAPPKPKTIVRVSSLLSDGYTYGVGMPIVLYFSPLPKDVRAFEAAVKVTANGQPVNGAWYWEQPLASEVSAHVVEAHYRPANYWPAHSKIHVSIPIGGVSAGPGMAFSGKLDSLDYSIGAAHISYVDASSLRMKITSDGKTVNNFPVSLGAAQTPTYNGTKVVMQKGEDIPGTDRLRPNGTVMMNGPGYTNDPVQWSVRITQSGEYVHSAPWNHGIGERSTSNGCTNLLPADGKWFYNWAQVGDVVTYTNTDGTAMRPDDGLGDWNIPWSVWQRGGMFAA